MGKVVKYCASCEESFAEKFSFCPNCASGLTAYEMNPVMAEPPTPEPIKVFEPTLPTPAEMIETPPVMVETVETPTAAFQTISFEKEAEPEAPAFLSSPTDDILEIEEEVTEEFTTSAPLPTVPAIASNTFEDYQQTYQNNSDKSPSANSPSAQTESHSHFVSPVTPKKADDDGFYHVTFVQPKGEKSRNALLLGASLLILFGCFGFFIYSLMNHGAYIAAIDDSFSGSILVEEAVAEEEEEPEEPKNKDKDDGGGGGGGRKEPIETSKGRLAQQIENPIIPPNARMSKVDNPDIPIQPATQGNKTVPPSDEPYGNPKSRNINVASDGQGDGGGQGSGQGTGQGSGRGTGQGSGIGSGSGSGIGSGNGGGSGRGSGNPDDDDERTGRTPPAIKVGPTENIKILSKPRPPYTDAARTNQVQGTVTLRVTFLANGSVGSISTVSGLGHGLTEQAIAAARGIRFEPAKKNGVPYAVTKQVQFNFTLY